MSYQSICMNSVTVRTHQEGENWVKANAKLWSTPGIILLNGPMGAGKTQITRWILAELGSQEVASPTFAIHHRYEVEKLNVDHFDLYRLESDFELENTGFWDILSEPDNLALVEWADRLPKEAFPTDKRIVVINIDLKPNGTREITWL